MTELTEQRLDWLHGLCTTDPLRALEVIKSWELEFGDDLNFNANKSSYLIDAGSSLRDSEVIEQGIALLEQEKYRNQGNLSTHQWYNLGNGYYAAESSKRGPTNVYSPTDTPMVKAKHCYRHAIETLTDEDAQFRASLHVNYGNSLDELGRFLEANDEFEHALEIDPEHPIAWNSLGWNLMRFARTTLDAQQLSDANSAFTEALCEDRLERNGYGNLRQGIKERQRNVHEWLKQVDCPHEHKHESLNISQSEHQAFADFCAQRRLFLNFSLRRRPSPHPYEDSFRFTLITRIDDDARLSRLVRVLNELSERFAIARILLFEAYAPQYDLTFYDTVTRYIDLLDYSVYGVRSAKLKLAVECAYNILDKIALFLNEYLELGMDEKKVDFFTVWKEKRTHSTLRSSILARDNIFLYALYDISCDFDKGGHFFQHKELRNASTHRYFVLHSFRDFDWQMFEGADSHGAWDEVMEQTQALLYITRNALIYLIAAIDKEERIKSLTTRK